MPAESQRSSRTKKKLRKYFRKQNNQQQKKQCAFGYPRIAPSNEEIIIILQLSMIIGLAEKCRARRLPFAFSLFSPFFSVPTSVFRLTLPLCKPCSLTLQPKLVIFCVPKQSNFSLLSLISFARPSDGNIISGRSFVRGIFIFGISDAQRTKERWRRASEEQKSIGGTPDFQAESRSKDSMRQKVENLHRRTLEF